MSTSRTVPLGQGAEFHQRERRPRPASGPKSGFRADIQALRAIAVGMVVLGHVWPDKLTGGYVGVDVFFVISGFLITSHLSERDL